MDLYAGTRRDWCLCIMPALRLREHQEYPDEHIFSAKTVGDDGVIRISDQQPRYSKRYSV